MKTSGAQPGNTNARKGGDWNQALRMELAALGRKARDQRKKDGNAEDGDDSPAFEIGLRVVARKCIGQAATSFAAIKEIGDRMDGRVAQAVEHTGAGGKPIDIKWLVEVVEPGGAD